MIPDHRTHLQVRQPVLTLRLPMIAILFYSPCTEDFGETEKFKKKIKIGCHVDKKLKLVT